MARSLFFIAVFFTTTTCTPCNFEKNNIIPMGYNYKSERTVKYLPRSSFVHVLIQEKYEYCYMVKEKKECIILDNASTSSGSGFVVHNTTNGSLVITADHICGLTSDKMTQTLTLTDLNGEEYEAAILERNKNKQDDICMVYAKGLEKPPVKIALNKPLPGAKLYNIAAPAGIFNAGMVPILEGRYNGISFHGCAMYSIPAAGGSSGSMVLNNNFELVGLIHSLHTNFPTITLGPKFEVISKFIRKGIKKHFYL